MIDISIERSEVNIEALNAQLSNALGDAFIGVSTGNGEVTVHLVDESTSEQQDQARAIVVAHDPTQLTPAQQLRAQHQQALEQLRQANTTPLDLSAYSGEDAAIQQLAQKVAWLEMEFLVSQGG